MLLAVSLVTVNVAHWDGHVLFLKPSILLAALAFAFLIAVLTAAAGVLFSLRAATAQEAQQTLMGVLLIPPVILQFALFAILASESGKARLTEVWEATSLEQVIIVIVAILLLLDLGLLIAAMARFKRARLILS